MYIHPWLDQDMAKRGETRPWKIHFQWTNPDGTPGSKGTIACHSEDEATFRASEIQRHGGFREDGATVTTHITHREEAKQ